MSVAIIIGNLLGAGKTEEAKDQDTKLMVFSTATGILIGLMMVATAPFFPEIYETTDAVKSLATYMMIVSAITMPFASYANAAYFTLRSGGKVSVTLLFDCVYMWVLVVPLAFVLSLFKDTVNIQAMFAICAVTDVIKAVFGYALLKKGTWAKKLV